LKKPLAALNFRAQKKAAKNQVLLEEIVQKVSKLTNGKEERKYLLAETAAFLCQLGQGKAHEKGKMPCKT
jgi:hypothetical protein